MQNTKKIFYILFLSYWFVLNADAKRLEIYTQTSTYHTVYNKRCCKPPDSTLQLTVASQIYCATNLDNSNAFIDVPVTVTNFRNIVTLQTSIVWDSTFLRYGTIVYMAPGIGLRITDFNNPYANTLLFSWLDSTIIGQTIPDTSTLFSIRFFVNSGAWGHQLQVQLSDFPNVTEAYRSPDVQIPVEKINGLMQLSPMPLRDTIRLTGCQTIQYQGITYDQTDTVSVTIKSALNCDSILRVLYLQVYKPVASFNINDSSQCFRGNRFVCNNLSVGASEYNWSFSDGSPLDTASNIVQRFGSTGTFSIQLIAFAAPGCSDTTAIPVQVYESPVASFLINNGAQCLHGNNFMFTNTSTIVNGTLQFRWNFGDNILSTATNDTHVYYQSGAYTVQLTVLSESGCSDSAIQQVTVYSQPDASFRVNDTSQCLTGNAFIFTNNSLDSSGTVSYSWALGDSTIVIISNVNHSYLLAGTYTVKLVATSTYGCKDSSSVDVIVYPMPSGMLAQPQQNIICDGTPVLLTASGAVSYQWYLNGANISGATGAEYAAGKDGIYTVEFVSAQGCKTISTGSINLSLFKKPVANFIFEKYCVHLPVRFINQTTSSNGPLLYTWNFGDGSVNSGVSPSHLFDSARPYSVMLQAASQRCPQLIDTAIKTVNIQMPVPGIRYTPLNAVAGRPLQLNARNIGLTFLWSPAVGLNSTTIINPVLYTNQERTYHVSIEDAAGCKTVDTQLVRIFRTCTIHVPDAFTPNGDGVNDRMFPFVVGLNSLKYFRIYNRWGNLVFESNTSNPTAGWDGRYKGMEQPPETYLWIASGIDPDGVEVKQSGNFILIR